METLGDHLRARRLDLGLEQKDAARMIGVHPASITKWELNRSQPSIRHYPRISEFLGYCILQHPGDEGERLRQLRRQAGLSIRKLAETLGVDEGSLSAWEAGTRRPSGRSLAKISGLWRAEE